MACNIDSLLEQAQQAIDNALADVEAKLDELKNLDYSSYVVDAETYLVDRVNGLIDKGIAAFQAQVSALIEELQPLIDLYNQALEIFSDIGAALEKLTQSAIEQIADLIDAVLENVPDLGPLSTLVDAIKNLQCLAP